MAKEPRFEIDQEVFVHYGNAIYRGSVSRINTEISPQYELNKRVIKYFHTYRVVRVGFNSEIVEEQVFKDKEELKKYMENRFAKLIKQIDDGDAFISTAISGGGE